MTDTTGIALPPDQERTPADSTPDERRSMIGGSDAAAVVGLSRWRSPVTVWAEKVGAAPPREVNPLRFWVGLRLEPMLAEMTEARLGIQVRRDRRTFRDSMHHFLGGHIDFRELGRPRGIEVKTSRAPAIWGDDGTVVTFDERDAIPIDYYLQVQHYLLVTGWDEFIVAVLIGHDDFRTYSVPRHDRTIRRLREAEVEFWTKYVLTETPPPIDGSDASSAWLRRTYPDHDDILVPATPEQEENLIALARVKAKIKLLEGQETLFTNVLAADIGTHFGLSTSWGDVTRKRTKDTEAVDWATVALEFRNALQAVIGAYGTNGKLTVPLGAGTIDVDGSTLDAMVSLSTRVKPGYRRLHLPSGVPTNGDEAG